MCYGLFQLDVFISVFAVLCVAVLSDAQSESEKCGADCIQHSVLRVGRAGVRIFDGGHGAGQLGDGTADAAGEEEASAGAGAGI